MINGPPGVGKSEFTIWLAGAAFAHFDPKSKWEAHAFQQMSLHTEDNLECQFTVFASPALVCPMIVWRSSLTSKETELGSGYKKQ